MVSDLYIRMVEQQSDLKQLLHLEYDMLESFVDLVSKSIQRGYSPLVRKAYKFIQQNSQRRLSLAEIAEYTGVHPNYLSKLFSDEVHQSVMSFYEDQRCSAIKLFLSHTNISQKEIAMDFDFSSQSYFCNFFKKKAGTTPSEYRKEKRNR